MYYGYHLESVHSPQEHYLGHTDNLRRRLMEHNEGRSPHTAKHRPWNLAGYHAIAAETLAVKFERYLKSGSGRAFARRHCGL